MKLWIPRCGDAAILDADWTFTLQSEYRNNDAYDLLRPSQSKPLRHRYDSHGPDIKVTFVVGTELVFDRIYIRQGKGYEDFASVTFIIKEHANDALVGERFWVKLEDANKMDLTPTTVDNPVGGFAKQRYKSKVKDKNDPTGAAKKAAKDAKTKAAKAELDAAREAVQRECADPKSPHAQHINDMITAIMKNWSSHQHVFGDRSSVRRCMTDKPYNKRSPRWSTQASYSGRDGARYREFSFWYDQKHWGGFVVTTKAGVITKIDSFMKAKQ